MIRLQDGEHDRAAEDKSSGREHSQDAGEVVLALGPLELSDRRPGEVANRKRLIAENVFRLVGKREAEGPDRSKDATDH